MSVGLYSHTTRGTGTVLTAAIYNADHINHITNQNPAMTGGYADSVGQYQTKVDPGGVGTESLSPNLAGELERLRFCIARITGKTQWYEAPQSSLQQALGGTVPGTIATAGGTPLTLRRTENDAVDRTVLSLEEGSGAGAKAEWKVKGGTANDVTEVSLFLNNIEQLRYASNIKNRYAPQGYLTPTTGVPVIVADASAQTSLFYEPLVGNLVPIIQNGVIAMRTFAPFTLALNNPNHAAATLYDVFLWDIAGVVTIGTGPAWANSGAGTSSRGAGAGTTELVRTNGLWVNAVSMTTRNGAGTFAVGAGLATYLGTILIDAVGTVTCHRSWGQNRKWCVWNAYNRQPLYLKAGDSTATWNYQGGLRASNNLAANSLTVLSGLAEEFYHLGLAQRLLITVNAASDINVVNGIGWNSVAAITGRRGTGGTSTAAAAAASVYQTVTAEHIQEPTLGIHLATALEAAPTSGGTAQWNGGEDDMILHAKWRG